MIAIPSFPRMLLHLRRYLTPIIMQNDAIIWREKYNHPVGWDQHFSPLSLPEMFFQSADRDPDAVLLDFLGRRYSSAECREGVRRVAHGLQAMGIGQRSEKRRVGKEWVSTCSSRGWQYNKKKK